jgi:hypothetical protein
MNNNYIGVDLALFRHPEIQKLEIQLGKGAVAIYLQICFKLAEMEGRICLDDIPILEREFFVKLDLLEKIIHFQELFIIKDNYFYCEWVKKRLKKISEKSEAGKRAAQERWKKKASKSEKEPNADALQTDMRRHSEPNAIKERKESKENNINESKEKEVEPPQNLNEKLNKLIEVGKIQTPFDFKICTALQDKIKPEHQEEYLDFLINVKSKSQNWLKYSNTDKAYTDWWYADFLSELNLKEAQRKEKEKKEKIMEEANTITVRRSDFSSEKEFQNELALNEDLGIKVKILN